MKWIYSPVMNFSRPRKKNAYQSSLKINRYLPIPLPLILLSTRIRRCSRWAGNELLRIFCQGIWIIKDSLRGNCVIPWMGIGLIGVIILRIYLLKGIVSSQLGIFKIIQGWISRMRIMRRRKIREIGLLIIGKIRLFKIFYHRSTSVKGKKCMSLKIKCKIPW